MALSIYLLFSKILIRWHFYLVYEQMLQHFQASNWLYLFASIQGCCRQPPGAVDFERALSSV